MTPATLRSNSISAWFLHNPTAANLLMVVFVLSGIVAIFTMRQEVFPNAVLDTIEIRTEYRGATATEVEAQVVRPMEQSINTLRDIRTVVSEIQSGGANIFVMLEERADAQRTIDEIRSAIDGLNALPADLEPPTIIQVRDGGGEVEFGFYGFDSQSSLHNFAQYARETLLARPEIGQVELEGAGEPEITVRVAPEATRLYGLSLSDVAARVNSASFELSGGAIRSDTGEYGLATGLDRTHAHEFADIAVIGSADGAPLTLGHIAQIENGFRPHGKRFRINGSMAVLLTVYGAGGATPGQVSTAVQESIEVLTAALPDGGALVFDDDAKSYADRVGILADSAFVGLALVLVLLFLVLEPRVAFWVAVGLPVTMLGGAALFALTPYTINFISIFSFIIVIGVVVDDAVVVGESIFSGIQTGMTPIQAAEDTVARFSGAIVLAILTNIIAFTPIFFMPGQLGLFLLAIPVVTTCVFIVSLIEALWILPAHLAHGRATAPSSMAPSSGQTRINRRGQLVFEALRDGFFVPGVKRCLANRGLVICVGLLTAGAIFSWAASGRMPIALQPAFEGHEVAVIFGLTPGASDQQLDDMAEHIERLGRGVLADIGEEADLDGVRMELASPAGHQGRVIFTLALSDSRAFTAGDFAERLRDRIGQPSSLTELALDYQSGPGDGRDLTLELSHADDTVSRQAAETLVRQLGDIAGVGQISYSGNAFRSEVRFELTTTGRALGFDEAAISQRLRAQLDGLEATRLTRGRDEVRVMIRGMAPGSEVLPALENLVLVSGDGRQVALGDIANIRWERGAVQLRRINAERIERVEATIDERLVSKNLVEDLVAEQLLPQLEAQYPGLTTWDEAIDTDEDAETAQGLLIATVAVMVTIFVLIGAYARSLRHSAILLASIPLSASGALLGHLILGVGLSAATFLGVLALAGLVINAGLLLHLRYREGLSEGLSPEQAMLNAVHDRFRPIVLSSVTTLFGLAPLIFSTSVAAAAMRPVAVSVGFGMLFSIPVILLLMPCIMVALERSSDRRTVQPNAAPQLGALS